MDDDDGASEALIGKALGLDRARHHVLLCAGPNCCTRLQADESWSELRLQLRKQEAAGRLLPQAVRASRVSCLGICRSGPILVVYPDGTWYREASAAQVTRIVRQHLVEGRPVASHVFCANDLRGAEGD